jgi:phosphatidylserine/phosphatidylglycerophosphate/cardiolipin synthase-like enzyme
MSRKDEIPDCPQIQIRGESDEDLESALGTKTLFGSTNWGPRSLKLNFELNVECCDREFAPPDERARGFEDRLFPSRRWRSEASRSVCGRRGAPSHALPVSPLKMISDVAATAS